MEQKRKINIDVFIGIALTIAAIFFFTETLKINPGAAKFPRAVYGLFIAMSVLLTINGIRKTLKPSYASKNDFNFNFRVMGAPLAVFGIVAIYMALMYFTGFFISTAIFVPVFMLFYGIKNIRTILITDIALNLFVYILFVQLLRVTLP
jgi:hypothetical protein